MVGRGPPPARPFDALRQRRTYSKAHFQLAHATAHLRQGERPHAAGWIPARRRNDGVKGGRGDWTPLPRFLAEPRNDGGEGGGVTAGGEGGPAPDSSRGLGMTGEGCDGLVGRGPPPARPFDALRQRRTYSKAHFQLAHATAHLRQGERPYPAEWHEKKGWGEVLGSGLILLPGLWGSRSGLRGPSRLRGWYRSRLRRSRRRS